jgi:hypothetical protein
VRTLRATVGLGAVHAAGALTATGLIIASLGLLAGFLVAVVLVAGRFLGAVAATLAGDRRPSIFRLGAAVVSLAAIGFAATASTTIAISTAAGVTAMAIGALADVVRQPSGAGMRSLVRAGASIGVLGALVVTVAVAGGKRAAEWRHGGLIWILATAALLVVVAFVLGRPVGSQGPGSVVGRPRLGPGLGGALRTASANLRWYPVIPVIGAVLVANAPGVVAVLLAWMGLLLKGRDRADEIREALMRPTHVGHLEPSINDEDPEFHTGRGGYGDRPPHVQYGGPGRIHLPIDPNPTAASPDSGRLDDT